MKKILPALVLLSFISGGFMVSVSPVQAAVCANLACQAAEAGCECGVGITTTAQPWCCAAASAVTANQAGCQAQPGCAPPPPPPGPVKCVKLGADVKWTGGYIYTGTLKNEATGADVTCSEASPCKCNDASVFAKGCRLIKDNTVGPRVVDEPGTTCTQKNKAGTENQVPDYQTPAWGMIGLLNGIGVVTNWIFVILMIIVGLFVIWGAFDITTAAGSPEKVGSGRNKILYALIGLAVAFLAKALPGIVSALLGV